MHTSRLPVLLLVLAGVLWGTGGLIGSALGAAAGLGPLAVACYRLGAGGALLLVARAVTRPRLRQATSRFGPGTKVAFLNLGATGVLAAAFQACYFAAVARTSVGLATFVAIGTAPVVVLAADRLRGRPVPRRVLVGGALALAGLGLLVGTPGGGADPVGGALLAVVSGCGFAAMSLLAGRPVPGLSAATSTGASFLLGALVLAPFALAAGGLAFTPTPGALVLLVALGTVPTALAYAAYFTGLRSAPAGVGTLLALLEPLTAAGLAALVLGQGLGAGQAAGAGLLSVALVLVASAPTREVVVTPG